MILYSRSPGRDKGVWKRHRRSGEATFWTFIYLCCLNLRSWCSVDEIVTGNLVEAYDTTGRKILVQIGKFLLFPVNVFMAKSYSI